MSKPIVVGVNGSAGSEAALAWALERAAADNAPVLCVHAVDDRWMSPDFQYHELIRQSGMELLEKAKAAAAKQAPDVTVDTELRHGSPGDIRDFFESVLEVDAQDAFARIGITGHARFF